MKLLEYVIALVFWAFIGAIGLFVSKLEMAVVCISLLFPVTLTLSCIYVHQEAES